MKKYIVGLLAVGFIIAPWLSFAEVEYPDPSPSTSDCISIVNNLRYRDRDVNKNGEISTLQDFLQVKGYLNNEPTGYFGILTMKAVKSFQRENDISPTGYVGPITRGKIKTLTCDGIIPQPNEQKFTGYLTLQGPSITMWGTHTLAVDTGVRCFVAPCPGASKSYLVDAKNNSVLSDLYRYQNNNVAIWGELKWYQLEGGFWGITVSKVVSLSVVNSVKPIISGVSGPQSLNENETGTWKINAYDPNGGNLSYSVIWGDEPMIVCHTIPGYPCSATAKAIAPQQSATFTHSYSVAGRYMPKFTVTNDNGQKAETSLTVKVKVIEFFTAPSVTVLSPNGGEIVQLGQSYIIKWNTTGFSPSDNVFISLKDNSINCNGGMVGCWTTFGIGSTKNTGSYIWNTNLKMFGDGGPNSQPVYVGNNFRILLQVESANNSAFSVSDYSDNLFTIQ